MRTLKSPLVLSQFLTRLAINRSGHVVAETHQFRGQRRNNAVEVEYVGTCSTGREKETGNATDSATIVNTSPTGISDPETRLAGRVALD